MPRSGSTRGERDLESDSQATCGGGPVAFCAATVSSSNPVSPAYVQKRKSVWTPDYAFMQSAITQNDMRTSGVSPRNDERADNSNEREGFR